MNHAAFLSAVKEEIVRLQQIQNLLENDSTNATSIRSTKPSPGSRKSRMSAEGRARIAEAQRMRWAVKKAAVEAASAPAKKQPSAPAKRSAKAAAVMPVAEKQIAFASKPAAGKTAAPAKKVVGKKPAAATKPTAAKKASAAKRTPADQAAPKRQARKQPDSNTRAEATEANAPVLGTIPAVAEDVSSKQ